MCVNKLVLGNIAFGEVKDEEEAKEARKKTQQQPCSIKTLELAAAAASSSVVSRDFH